MAGVNRCCCGCALCPQPALSKCASCTVDGETPSRWTVSASGISIDNSICCRTSGSSGVDNEFPDVPNPLSFSATLTNSGGDHCGWSGTVGSYTANRYLSDCVTQYLTDTVPIDIRLTYLGSNQMKLEVGVGTAGIFFQTLSGVRCCDTLVFNLNEALQDCVGGIFSFQDIGQGGTIVCTPC